MRMKHGVTAAAVLGLAGFLVCAAGVPAHAASPASPAQIATGKKLFQSDCAVCHKASGAGGVHFGDTVSADLQAPGLEKLYRHDDALIVRAILTAHDQNDQPLDMPMPAWKGRLTHEQAEDIVAYLHTLHS